MRRDGREKTPSHSALIVDADPAVLMFVSALLEDNGIRALRARNCAEARQIADREYVPIDLILTSSRMEGEERCELMSYLLESRPDLQSLSMSVEAEAGIIRVALASEQGSWEGGSREGLPETIRGLLVHKRFRTAGQSIQ